MAMLRQIEFSLFDFRIHQEYESTNHHLLPIFLRMYDLKPI